VKKYNVISVDMFGTLADIDSTRDLVWKGILKEFYKKDLAESCWDRTTELLFKLYEERIVRKRENVPLKELYKECYTSLFAEKGLDLNPAEAARTLAHYHTHCELFDDVIPFLTSVGKEYPICIASDTDEDMLGRLRDLYPFDCVFTSEQIGVYKTSSDGRFFSSLVEYYGVEPGTIIHIGDMVSDITGTSEAGITNCWLNRRGKTWEHEITPDFEVSSLYEFAKLLNIEIKPDTA
jgi:FMN phosphatase YigB (HAD superfamily)